MRRKLEIALICLLAAGLFFGVGFYLGRNSRTGLTLSLDRQPVSAAVDTSAQVQADTSAQTQADTSALRMLPETEAETEAAQTEATYPVHLNTATKEQLMSLPNIGEKRAQSILDYRQQHGPFTSAEQLLQIDGIGEKTLEGLLDYITLD